MPFYGKFDGDKAVEGLKKNAATDQGLTIEDWVESAEALARDGKSASEIRKEFEKFDLPDEMMDEILMKMNAGKAKDDVGPQPSDEFESEGNPFSKSEMRYPNTEYGDDKKPGEYMNDKPVRRRSK